MPNKPKFIRKRGYTPPTNDFKLLSIEQFQAEEGLDAASVKWMIDGQIVGFTGEDHKYYYTPEPWEITELREAATDLLNANCPAARSCARLRLGKALEPFEGVETI